LTVLSPCSITDPEKLSAFVPLPKSFPFTACCTSFDNLAKESGDRIAEFVSFSTSPNFFVPLSFSKKAGDRVAEFVSFSTSPNFFVLLFFQEKKVRKRR